MYETQIASTNNIIVKNCGLVMMERKFQSVNKLQMLQQMMIAMVWKVSGKQKADFHIDLIEQKWIWTGKKEKKQRMERKKEKPVRCLNSELDCNQHFSNWLPWTTEKKAFGYLQSPLMLSSQQPPCISWQTVLCSWAMTMDDHRHDWGGVGGLIGHFKSHSALQKIT